MPKNSKNAIENQVRFSGKVEAGKVEAGKVETGKVEAGKVETGKVETGKVETGKVEKPNLKSFGFEVETKGKFVAENVNQNHIAWNKSYQEFRTACVQSGQQVKTAICRSLGLPEQTTLSTSLYKRVEKSNFELLVSVPEKTQHFVNAWNNYLSDLFNQIPEKRLNK